MLTHTDTPIHKHTCLKVNKHSKDFDSCLRDEISVYSSQQYTITTIPPVLQHSEDTSDLINIHKSFKVEATVVVFPDTGKPLTGMHLSSDTTQPHS